MNSRIFLRAFAAIFSAAAVAVSAIAAEYPDRPVSVIVAYSPGGATDFQARIVTMMSGSDDFLGQPIVILNKPGAGGKVGWSWFAENAKKDGYELAAYNIPHFIAQSIVFDTKYDIRNLEPIANWGADPAVLVVGKDSPFNTAEEFVAYAKKNPGKLTVSGAGLYVGHHIAALQLEKAADIKLQYIPHKGGVPALKSVMGGQVMGGFNNLSDAYRNRARLKILAVADLQRNAEFLPDVPTLKEAGFDVDDSSVNFRGIMAPGGTSPTIIATLADKVPLMFENPKVLAKMQSGGSPVRIIGRDEVIVMWQEREKYLRELLADLKKE